MGLPGRKTAAEYIPWDDLTYFISCLERDGQYKLCLISAFCSFWALRIGDALELKWSDIFETGSHRVRDVIVLDENKNRGRRLKNGSQPKLREIHVNEDVKSLVARLYPKMDVSRKTDLVFLNENKAKAISKQYINRRLKNLGVHYRLNVGHFSSHSFRKSFGRKVLQDHNFSAESRELLIKIYGHPDWSITKEYLGFTKEETINIYNNLRF